MYTIILRDEGPDRILTITRPDGSKAILQVSAKFSPPMPMVIERMLSGMSSLAAQMWQEAGKA